MVTVRRLRGPAATGWSPRPNSASERRRGAHSSRIFASELMTRASRAQAALSPAEAVIQPGTAEASAARDAPATVAAGRVFRVSMLLGVLGLASALFVITRLFESWRVTSDPASHVVSVFGQRLSYPAANAGAVVVTALAGLGLLIVGAAAWGLARELLADRSFRRALRGSLADAAPRSVGVQGRAPAGILRWPGTPTRVLLHRCARAAGRTGARRRARARAPPRQPP